MNADMDYKNNDPASLPGDFTERMKSQLGKDYGSFIDSYKLPYSKARNR